MKTGNFEALEVTAMNFTFSETSSLCLIGQESTVKNKTLPLQNSLRFSSIALHGRDKTLKSKYETDVGLYVLSDRIKSLHGRVFVLLSRVKTLFTSEEAFMIRAPSIRIGITDTKQTIPVVSKYLKRNEVFSTK